MGVVSMFGVDDVDFLLICCNFVVKGINLLVFKGCYFQIGEMILEMIGFCEFCLCMEENFGFGGYNVMCGYGGICV